MPQPDDTPPIIGWRERVDLPAWGLRRVKAKTDTGARTSAIDVAQIQELPDGQIKFEVVYRTQPNRLTKWVRATPVRTTTVRPSHGEAQTRYVCLTRVIVGRIEREIEISLVCRQGMLCRMLLGRTALDGILVDPSRKHLLTPEKRVKGDA